MKKLNLKSLKSPFALISLFWFFHVILGIIFWVYASGFKTFLLIFFSILFTFFMAISLWQQFQSIILECKAREEKELCYVQKNIENIDRIQHAIIILSATSTQLQMLAEEMSKLSREMNQRSNSASTAADEMSQTITKIANETGNSTSHVEFVAIATEEMKTSIGEIAG